MGSDLNPKLLDIVEFPSSGDSSLRALTGTVVEVFASGAVLVEVSTESGIGKDFVNIPADAAHVIWRSKKVDSENGSHDSAQILFEDGLLLLQNGLLAGARDKFASSFELDPNRARGLLNSTLELAAKGAFDPAIVILRLIVELQPAYSLARENLAKTHLNRGVHNAQRGALDKAFEDFTNALLIGTSSDVVSLARSNLAAAHTQIALRHIEIQRFDEAMQLFLLAFQLEPSRATRNNFALALVSRSASKDEGRTTVNEEVFRQPILMGLTMSQCLNAYGATLARLGDITRGRELVVRATIIDPSNELAKKNLEILSESSTPDVPSLAIWANLEPQSAPLHATH